MAGLGSIGCGAGGNSSSSSSNLSALAPPFTVDRLNTQPNSNPLLHYPDPPYSVESFSHAWQYARPSAPGPELVVDSTGIASVPLSDEYRFSASPTSTHWSAISPGTRTPVSAFAYGGEVKPYYSSPYAPSLVGEDSLLVKDEGSHYNAVPTSGLSVTSQFDYTQSLFDLEYGHQWVDGLGFDDGKRAKRVELDGSFSSEKANVGASYSYNNQLNQGGCVTENRNKSKEDPAVSYKKLNKEFDREVQTGVTGPLNVGHIEDKSCLEQNLGFFPYDSNTSHILASSSTYPESHPSVLSWEVQKNFSNYQNSYSPYEKCVGPTHTPFHGTSSVTRPSPALVIRPPTATTSNLGQITASCRPARSDNVGGFHGLDSDQSNPSKWKDSGLKPSSEIKEDPVESNLSNFSKQRNDLISSTSVKEHSSPLHSKDTSDYKIKARWGSQLQDINACGGFPMVCDNQVVNSTEDSSDLIDHHNPAEDSPCWKGAPSSDFSQFDVEAGNSKHVKKNLDEYYRFNHEEHQNLHSVTDCNRVFPEKTGGGNKTNQTGCARNGGVLTSERSLDAICSSKDQSLLGGAESRIWSSALPSSRGVERSDDPNMLTKQSCLVSNLNSGLEMKVSDTKHLIGEAGAGLTLNDVSEGGAVAVHAAEKVLASPASQEDANERIKLPDPKLNVPTMIKAIHNLSELLLFQLSNNACSLEEENTETLKHVMSNLDSCVSKSNVQATNKSETSHPVGDKSEKLGQSSNMDKISGSPHTRNEAANTTVKLDYQYMHEEERNYSFFGKKDEKSQILSPLRDDINITRDDDMAKAIKKVLEENFHFNEEMHSQALLFKSLWLEAEAKLCSISYKARFDRMKIQMEETKLQAPQEMMSKVCVSADPMTPSKLAPKAHYVKIPQPTLYNFYMSGMSGHADDVDASVMARFNILKSREDNLKPINKGEDQHPEMVDDEHAGSVMARFNVLKSRENNSKPINMEEEQHPDMVDSEPAGSIMARFNILESREDNPNPINMEEKRRPEMVDCDHTGSVMARFNILKSRENNSNLTRMEEEQRPQIVEGEKYLGPYGCGQSEDETLNVAQKSHFLHQTGGVSEGKFGSCVDGAGCESPTKFHLSVMGDPIIQSFKNSRMIDQSSSGWRDSSSSDWEHVLKDDFSWKNM
ncbi:uncharacterized protein LOC105160266 isoform X2 [Sesamum indicum]|uniref:Uncharacterized protein LOC105160266 isoform X2 n=1 Tax=Sesamum indicum TaxID=4182 RepID=A0A6I9SY63_SESIN|nr:uncharacterized protein LOC105160266 isoform X2 [Sesamum indicum]